MQKLRSIQMADAVTDAILAAKGSRPDIRLIVRQALEAYALEALEPSMDANLPQHPGRWGVSDHRGGFTSHATRLTAVRLVNNLLSDARIQQYNQSATLWLSQSFHQYTA